MELRSDGFYSPCLKGNLTQLDNKLIKQVCPGIHIEGKPHKGAWGPMLSICQAWSSDEDIRYKAASGGVVTSLAICLLEHHLVDAILQVGVRDDSYLYNELRVSKTKEDVLNNAQSRYAPALVFHRIKEILDSGTETYALIGKPCDMAAMQNLVRTFPKYQGRIKYYISIFCAGMPSYNATMLTWQQSGHKDEPVRIKYRGDGWPGFFTAYFKDGSKYQLSYNDSWGNILGHHLGFRCKICPDGIGALADISVGDAWNTKNGYPDFTEDKGRCFCMLRTEKGVDLINKAENNGYIEKEPMEIGKICEQQPYQWERRKLEGWRLLPVQYFTRGILHFKHLSIWNQAMTIGIKKGFRNALGTYLRMKADNGKQ